MPNHVKNVWIIKNLKKEEIEDVLNRCTSQIENSVYPLNCVIDFDKIIPEPKVESECPEDCKVNKDSHVALDKDRPWFNWYEWHNRYWGTKWNAYDCYTKIEESQVTFIFSTAWNLATPIVEKLEELGYDMDIMYADEDFGCNCGKLTYNARKHQWIKTEDKELPDSEQFAEDLWEKF